MRYFKRERFLCLRCLIPYTESLYGQENTVLIDSFLRYF